MKWINVICALVLFALPVQAATVRYQHTDMLGSVVSESDESGNIISRSQYEPFGKRMGGDKEGIGYTGHLQDKDLGLTYMQARYYDPLIGRFYANDPMGFKDVHNFNRYAYGNNNPYKYIDPDGNYAESLWDAASLSVGVTSMVSNLADGNFSDAGIDAIGVVADGVAIAIPIVPGGAGMAITASRGAESAVNAVKLEKQLASESQVSQLSEGGGTVISQPAKQADRIASQTGRDSANIQKVSSDSFKAKDGSTIQTHSFRDASTNELIEPKTIINEDRK
ncbi:hypothetical protein HT094_15155 [Shewanella sp. ZOR0012]|uniref:RHS repeat domain-containing protein n=1 Tax=Shewanella TaxID=22 RepID=UPI0009DEBBD4|nr:RHS repeat-associated core domain-containing protein [Shewanella sp. ZOR0012]NSM25525.1 hypothetical protein [Shewanella sp. ZOR0012]